MYIVRAIENCVNEIAFAYLLFQYIVQSIREKEFIGRCPVIQRNIITAAAEFVIAFPALQERGFTAAEFKAAQADGWEKQYPYKVGRKKVYMPPSEAEKHGYERANKHPKSTKFGRQNPIAERWNSEEQLVEWRKAWADVTNRYLEQYGHDERIDHRSHADRGLTEQPTIHEGVVARALEKKGIISDRCEINRQIKADNALFRELKATVKKLMQAVKNTVPAIAEAMEKIRSSMIIFSYQLRYIGVGKYNMGKRVNAVKPELERYAGLVQQIKEKSKERKNLLAEKKETPFYQIPKLHDLTRRITELTEEIEELKTEIEMLLRSLDCADDAGISDVKKEIATLEGAMQKLSEQEEKYSAELDEALKQYAELKEQAAGMDAVELMDARLAVREEKERSAIDKVKAAYGEKYDPMLMHDSKRDVANLLHEEAETPPSMNVCVRNSNQRCNDKKDETMSLTDNNYLEVKTQNIKKI